MPELERFSVSIEKPLYRRMRGLIKKRRYRNRSEYIRDLVRKELAEKDWKANEEALGTITLIFDHHKRQLSERLLDLQHNYHEEILASTHVHLDHHICAETILVKGKARKIEDLANRLQKEKGVMHAALSISSVGKSLS
ncbi:MAG: nickel-responsive transcriptional regulator NikR [Planctomycetota bacterium]|jgi:CopG family nickel-responsive transcriptional regulator